MYETAFPRVKICCIQNVAEMQLAVRYGATFVGLVGKMPSGFGPISEDTIAEIAAETPPGVSAVLLTSETRASAIIEQQRRTGVGGIQIVDDLTEGSYQELRDSLPGVDIIQVIHVTGPESVDKAMKVAPLVDAILLDSGQPDAEVKILGGTGKTHNWQLSARIRSLINKPLFLAGGLRPSNVAEAMRYVAPYALDLCTGLRTNGELDENKLTLFMKNIRAESATLMEGKS